MGIPTFAAIANLWGKNEKGFLGDPALRAGITSTASWHLQFHHVCPRTHTQTILLIFFLCHKPSWEFPESTTIGFNINPLTCSRYNMADRQINRHGYFYNIDFLCCWLHHYWKCGCAADAVPLVTSKLVLILQTLEG